jgi:hypothetical protein
MTVRRHQVIQEDMSHKYSVYTNHGGYDERWWGTFPDRNLALRWRRVLESGYGKIERKKQ